MILVVAGTRPEIIKLAPVYRALKRRKMDCRWVFSGQQKDLGPEAFGPFHMKPEHSHVLDRKDGTLTELMSGLAIQAQATLKMLRPEMVIVQGDTLTAAVYAQQAFLWGCRVAHVEAGLRSFNRMSPYPEEACRVWIDTVADLKFAPTEGAARNLMGDGVYVTGNTVIDALNMIKPRDARTGRYAVVTMHRRENAAQVNEVIKAVSTLAKDRVFDYLVWPVHPNPTVRDVVPEALKDVRNVEIVDPLPYDRMVNLVRYSKMLLTDSGGLQEEALALGIPCLVMRKETERPEGIETGGARLVGTDRRKIVGWAKWLMENEEEWMNMAAAPNPYGDGQASDRIVNVIRATLSGKTPDPRHSVWSPV